MRGWLAERWHCRPGDIDPDEDADEIGITLAIEDYRRRYTPQEG